jgi:N utilization substance protein B
MTGRSRAREVALQLLYQRDLNPHVPRAEVEQFVRDRIAGNELAAFSLQLFDGVVAEGAEIDRQVEAAALNWRLPRMAVVDRNVLRLGAYELLHGTEPAVAINEAVELARRFGGPSSPAFVNGVLDRIRPGGERGQ